MTPRDEIERCARAVVDRGLLRDSAHPEACPYCGLDIPKHAPDCAWMALRSALSHPPAPATEAKSLRPIGERVGPCAHGVPDTRTCYGCDWDRGTSGINIPSGTAPRAGASEGEGAVAWAIMDNEGHVAFYRLREVAESDAARWTVKVKTKHTVVPLYARPTPPPVSEGESVEDARRDGAAHALAFVRDFYPPCEEPADLSAREIAANAADSYRLATPPPAEGVEAKRRTVLDAVAEWRLAAVRNAAGLLTGQVEHAEYRTQDMAVERLLNGVRIAHDALLAAERAERGGSAP